MPQKMVNVNFKMFFDRPAVESATSRMGRKVLTRFGGYVRLTAKRSMRRRKKSSAPGSPPSAHEGSLKKTIFFGYDRERESVVAGPLGFKGSNAPEILEHGGETTIMRRDKKTGKLVAKRIKIQPRPFMDPAFEKGRKKLPEFWKQVKL